MQGVNKAWDKKISRVLFIGSKRLGLKILQQMHILSPAKLVGAITIDDSRDTRTVLEEYKKFAKRIHLRLLVAKNASQAEQWIVDLKPDLCFVVGWYWMLSSQLIDQLDCEFIGIHTSLLPKFRGGSPLVWAVINGEKVVGTSFFSLTHKMDAGPIWAQSRIRVNKDDHIAAVLDKLEGQTVRVFRKKYPFILAGKAVPFEQNHKQATYCAQRHPKDGIIDWQKSSGYVYNFIRAQSAPYPCAFTYLDGKMLMIHKAKLCKSCFPGRPGRVARIASNGVYVVCGDTRAVILQEAQLGRKRGKAGQFFKSTGENLWDKDFR